MEPPFSDGVEPRQTLISPIQLVNDVNKQDDTQFPLSESDNEIEDEEKNPNFDLKPSHEAKIRELLRNINSIEVKLCVDGSKEFIKLLKGSYGGQLLYEYVRTSSKLTELIEAWNRRRGKPGLNYILSLISVILSHPDGKYVANEPGRVRISRVLDKFGRLIVEEKLEDVYKEINSKEGKRQKAALLLLASVVRRGSLLAAEVAKSFNFKLPVLPKLSEYRRNGVQRKVKHSTRDAFIEFALSFLEVGKPGLLRWILQQREIFSGILRGLGDDDDETVVYVLSTLRDHVLVPESLVSPGLRSVLFGSVTLEQLVAISGRGDDGLGSKLACEVLLMVCTDPSNGLMPDLNRQSNPLKGNIKRLVGLMKKLKAIEVSYHRNLLSAIVSGRPLLGSSYLDEFPYNLEDNTSSTWVSAVTLAANVIRSVKVGMSWDFLSHQPHNLLVFESSDVQNVFKCICPRPFNRLILNKGLLHSDTLIKHATLRLLLEVLKFLSSFLDVLGMNKLFSLRQRVQDEVRILLPDPQVLFTLLTSKSAFKRKSFAGNVGENKPPTKKLKTDKIDEEVDILVGGLNLASEDILPIEKGGKPSKKVVNFQSVDDDGNDEKLIEIWGSCEDFPWSDIKNSDVHFNCQVLEVLKIFHGTLRAVLEVSYDFLKILPSNPLEVPSVLLQSLLSTLIEHLSCSQDFSPAMLPPIYKCLQNFLNLSLHSPSQGIKEQGYVLAKAAMRSTGAFDHDPWDIGAWFLFLPGYVGHENCSKYQENELAQSLSAPVVSFLCDAVSTVGNNLVKYLDLMNRCLCNVDVIKEQKVEFSPLVICVLDKCLRLLSHGTGTFTLPEKSMISLYVCHTLKYLLQTQVEAGALAGVINHLLSEKVEDHMSAVVNGQSSSCEWRPLVCLLFFSRSILRQETCSSGSIRGVSTDASNSFANAVSEVKSLLSRSSTEVLGISKALYSTTLCTSVDDVLAHLPSIMTVSRELPGFHQAFLSYFFHDQSLLNQVSNIWPDIFASSLGMSVKASAQVGQDNVINQTTRNTPCTDFKSLEYASVVLGSIFKEAPFHMFFPAVIVGNLDCCSEIKELLIIKLSNLTAEQVISSLRMVLFWFHQVQTSYRNKLSKQHEHLSELFYVLVECILAQLSKLTVNSASSEAAAIQISLCVQEVTKTVFCHPSVTTAFTHPFGNVYELSEELLRDTSEGFLHRCGKSICKMELHVLNILTTSCDYLLAICRGKNSYSTHTKCKENIAKTFRNFVQWLFMILKERLILGYRSKDITYIPVLYAVFALVRFISPIELLDLANWMLVEVEPSLDSILPETSSVSPACLAFSIACAAFDVMSECMQSPNMKAELGNIFWVLEEKFEAKVFESIYFKAFDSATSFENAFADLCLLKALMAAHCLSYRQEFLFVSMEIMRVVASTPVKVVSHCIHSTNNIKAKLLSLMIEMSPLHLSVFGHVFFGTLSKDVAHRVTSVMETNYYSLSNEEYLMLMPAVVSYICSSWRNLRERSCRHIEYGFSTYSRILLDGFQNWKYFVSRTAFQVECGNTLPCSVENLYDLFNCSLLGKAVTMLQWYFASNGDNMNERLKLFCSVCPCSNDLDGFLDFDIAYIYSYSAEQLLNFVIRVVAKISLSLILLFPESNMNWPFFKACESDDKSTADFCEENSSRVRLLDTLVYVWQSIIKKLPFASDNSEHESTSYLLVRSLEVILLRCIHRLTMEMQGYLIQMDSLPIVEKMAKASLLHRFGDPTTLKTLRHIFSSLSDGNLPITLLLQLILGHSQLALTIDTIIKSSNSFACGMIVKPISSFLRALKVPTGKHTSYNCKRYTGQLEVIKLFKLLYHLRARQVDSVSEDDFGVNSKELLWLLLPPYGATISDIDLEIYGLLSEIKLASGIDQNLIADLDYLWGSASLRVRKECSVDCVPLNNQLEDAEEDWRRSQFRDNLPVDPKLLIETILHFPYQRTMSKNLLFLNSSHQVNHETTVEGHSLQIGGTHCYDPVFILSFSIHALSMGYLDPVEFTGFGLLAIALVSIASPDDGIRKMGYDVLGRFNDALKECQKKREVTRLKLLLTYLQNGIEEPWQKIPTIAAVFVAEASVVLLDSSHEQYPPINKILMQSSRMNLKSIPLFHDVIWSSSLNFRTERLWMLQLLYAGINVEDDAQIYIRNSVLEILLSVYASPLSDNETKELILQVVKKCVKLQKMAHYLIENCCLILWLSSILSSFSNPDDHDRTISKQFILLLEVIHEVFSSRSTTEWLQNNSLEQLSDISHHLFKLLVRCSKFSQEAEHLVSLILEIIVLVLKISQKRETYYPHFTPSIRSLYQVFEAVDQNDSKQYSGCAELGLKTIVTSIPLVPTMFTDLGVRELSQFLKWAVVTAVQSDSSQPLQQTDLSCILKMQCEDDKQEESRVSTLLRWLAASVILWKVSCNRDGSTSRSPSRGAKGETLLSFVTYSEGQSEQTQLSSGVVEILAATIFYLQGLVGMKSEVLPSVVAALSILLLSNELQYAGSTSCNNNDVRSLWSKIGYPLEAYPSWRWSSEPQSVHVGMEHTEEKMTELHACQKLLIIISGVLRKKPSNYRLLSPQELESSGLFEWERTNLCK